MIVNVNENAGRKISSPKPAAGAAGKTKTTASSDTYKPQGDQVVISMEGRQAAQAGEPFSKLESAIESGDMAALVKAAKEKSGTLEINWNAMVDPDGSIYGAAYVESLLSQYQEVSSKIESYYAEAHQENLSYDNPLTHLVHKYKFPDSEYFQSDMTKAEREMAFEQERALLWGGHVKLNDPYALASSGGVLKASDAEEIARQAARDKLDQLIQERMKVE